MDKTILEEKNFKEIIDEMMTVERKMEEMMKRTEEYIKNLHPKEITKNKREKEEYYEEKETEMDIYCEYVSRRKIVMEKGKKMMKKMREMKEEMKKVMKSNEDEMIRMERMTNKIIEEMSEKKREETKKRIEEIEREMKEQIEFWESARGRIEEEKEAKEKAKRIKNEEEIGENKWKKEIEEWTGKRMKKILFDSIRDSYSGENNEFGKKIYGKKNVIIRIEDVKGNEYGGYISKRIDKYYDEGFINDKETFIYVIDKEKGMKKKYETKYNEYAFTLYRDNNDELIGIGGGHDICIYKSDKKKTNYIELMTYGEGEEYKKKIEIKRIMIIKME